METEPTMRPETAMSRWWRSRAGWCLLGIVLIATGLAPAAEIVVEGGCTLPDAITAANNDAPAGGCPAGSGADVIQLTGDVVLTSVDNNEVGDNGLPVVTTDITIVGGGSTIERDAAAPDGDPPARPRRRRTPCHNRCAPGGSALA